MAKKPVKKSVKKTTVKPAKKSAGKAVKKTTKRSSREAVDKSMAVVLQATGLGQLKPIRPSRKTAISPEAEPNAS